MIPIVENDELRIAFLAGYKARPDDLKSFQISRAGRNLLFFSLRQLILKVEDIVLGPWD
jgi:hypothetical protein